MTTSPTSLELETARFDREVSRFLRSILPELVDKAVRKLAFDVVSKVTRYLNGLMGLPKRIDTGRLRAAWRVALANGGLPTFGLPSGPASTADGEASITGAAVNREAVVINRVEYAPDVEHGTVHMEPGKHLETALRMTRRELPTSRDPSGLGKGVPDAFYGRS